MSKIMIGMAAAALWFLFAQAANAERVCHQVCDGGTCLSKCVEHSDRDVIVHEHDRGPGVHVGVPGVGVDIGR